MEDVERRIVRANTWLVHRNTQRHAQGHTQRHVKRHTQCQAQLCTAPRTVSSTVKQRSEAARTLSPPPQLPSRTATHAWPLQTLCTACM